MSYLWVLFASLFFSYVLQANEIIVVPDIEQELRLSTGFDVAIDHEGVMTIGEVASGAVRFEKTQLPFSAGHTRDTHWFRFTLQQTGLESISRLLIVEPRFIDSLTLYSPSQVENGGYSMLTLGDTIAVNHQSSALVHGAHTFVINLDDDKPNTFYLRMQSHDISLLYLTLSSREQFNQTNSLLILMSGFILGTIVLLMFNAFGLWRWLRQPTYLVIMGYAAVTLLNQVILNGLMSHYLLPSSPNIVSLLDQLSVCLQAVFFIVFIIIFFESKQHFPRLHRLCLVFLAFAIITSLSIPFDYFVDLAPYLSLSSLSSVPVLIYIAWNARREGVMGSNTVFVGTCIYAFLIMIMIMSGAGVIAFNPIVMNVPAVASLVFLFSMQQGMYKKVNQFELEKLAAEMAADVANKKAEEEKQRRNEQSTFMTMVAHEIHTPLSVIDSAIQTIKMSTPFLSSFITERHTRIQNSVSHLNQLLENTLETELSESRPLRPDIELINAEEFIAHVRGQSLSKRPHCVFNIGRACMIHADRQLLAHIVNNLLVNAQKYSPEETTIYMSVNKLEKEGKTGTLIRVTNNHISDTRPDTSRWLKKYFRQTDTPNITGFGLGLYLVKTITEAHEGDIDINTTSIQSTPDWLITVAVWLPDVENGNGSP